MLIVDQIGIQDAEIIREGREGPRKNMSFRGASIMASRPLSGDATISPLKGIYLPPLNDINDQQMEVVVEDFYLPRPGWNGSLTEQRRGW